LNYAVRFRDELLFNIYRMGKNSIEKGMRDTWTLYPKRSDEIAELYKKEQQTKPATPASETPESWGRNIQNIPQRLYDTVLKNPNNRDARTYIIPYDQGDFATATRFVNALIRTGVVVHKSSSAFSAAGKNYPAGSYVIKTSQAFRPHVIDLFEPQDHPNDFQYPGGPPVPPYDAAGWTLAYSMGITFDRLLDNVDGPFTRITDGEVQPLKGKMETSSAKAGYLLNSANNHAFIAVNEMLKKGIPVYRTEEKIKGNEKGSFYVGKNAKDWIQQNAAMLGADVIGVDKKPSTLKEIKQSRIALWDIYGGSMASGWMRWIFEQYHFNAEVIYASDIDKGNLNEKYDMILFVEGAMPSLKADARIPGEPKPEDIPEEFKRSIGNLSIGKSIPELKKFMEEGGKILTIGNSTSLAYHLNLPVRNALTEMVNGKERDLPNEKFYIPGSIMQITVNNEIEPAWGMKTKTDTYFEASPVFNIAPDAQASGMIKPIAWFSSDKTLRSGWAWGQAYLKDGIAAFSAKVGKGTLYAFGPEITFRAQTHGTFKFVFNQLYK